jgi:hypothetical protein
MGKKASKRRVAKRSKVSDLPARASRDRGPKGGLVMNSAAADGSVRPGQDSGVIAIIRPAPGTR